MQRYLLFDSGCSKCTEIAQEVERVTQGWLKARSLRDPDMRSLCEQARPKWRWEPTLLEVSNARVRAFTGLAMGIRLVMKLGPRRTLQLATLVGRSRVSRRGVDPSDLGRRQFLRQLAAAAFLFGLPKSWAFGETTPKVRAQEGREPVLANLQRPPGEVYEGFLLLPEDAPMPDFVQCAPAPILCQVDQHHDPALVGEITRFNSTEELANYIPFPMYIPATLPPNMRFASASVIRFAQSGDIFAATINFGATDTGQSRIIVRARPTYPRPYPIWPVHSPVSHERDIIYPEKVTFLPAPGIMRPSATGYVFNWIEQAVLFTLVAEHSPNRDAAEEIAKSLVQI